MFFPSLGIYPVALFEKYENLMTPSIPASFLFAALCAAPLQAAGGPIQLHLTAEQKTQTINAQGKAQAAWTALTARHAVHPGDILRYRVEAENTSAVPISGLVVTQPVSPATMYVSHSGDGPAPIYSLDGRVFSAQPMVTRQAGAVPAAPDTYTALRWRFSALAPHASVTVAYLVKVR